MPDIPALLNAQRTCFLSGATRELPFRRNMLERLKQAVLSREEELLAALKTDLGKPAFEAYETELGIVLHEISYLIRHLGQFARPRRVKTPVSCQPGKSVLYQEPYGVCLILAPWNYPVQLTLMPLAAALAAGNCAVVKPSELAPATSAAIAGLIAETFDPEIVCAVEGGREVNTRLLEESFDFLFFTGSVPVGKIVMRAAAEHLTPVVLELGGKSPCIIDQSANLALAAKRVAWGKFLNAGQTCVAPDYLLVHQKIYDAFLPLLFDQIRALWGTNALTNPDYAKIISRSHFDRLCSYLPNGTLLLGGQTDRAARKIAPTILGDIFPGAPVMEEEIFGPILPVVPYQSTEEAAQFVASRPSPLALYLFAEDKKVITPLMHGLRFGGGCLNDTIMHLCSPYLPFGGVGPSGMGSYHGRKSFETFSHQKSVLSRSTLFDVNLRYPPYKDKKLSFLRKILK